MGQRTSGPIRPQRCLGAWYCCRLNDFRFGLEIDRQYFRIIKDKFLKMPRGNLFQRFDKTHDFPPLGFFSGLPPLHGRQGHGFIDAVLDHRGPSIAEHLLRRDNRKAS